MPFSIYAMANDTFVPMLSSLSTLLAKAADQLRAKGQDPDTLLSKRLAPDMFPFVNQIQIACDHAKAAAARLTGQEVPRMEDNEKTLDQLQARIAATIAYVKSVPESKYEGAPERQIVFPLIQELVLDLNGLQYLRDWAFPNFYFHVVTAYDILRHNGVQIGKQDYMAHVGYAIHPRKS